MRVDELKKYEEYEEDEIEVSRFLEAGKGQAFTCVEVYSALRGAIPFEPDEGGSYWTWKNAGVLALNVLAVRGFDDKLKKMAATGKIRMKIADREEYYFVE